MAEAVAVEAPHDGLWRVYRQEWLIVYTSFKHGDDGAAECAEEFQKRWNGRVRPVDVSMVNAAPHTDRSAVYPTQILLRLFNMLGEFKGSVRAQAYERLHEGSVTVPRGGSAEQAMTDYGKRMLSERELTEEPCSGCATKCVACPVT